MSIHNPYAPPAAEVEAVSPDGTGLQRDGKLVRLEIGARFPDRCMRCNRPAERYRVERSVYWRPAWWRWTIWISFLLLFLVGSVEPLVLGLFWLAVIGFAIADVFVRRKTVVEYGLCERHRRLRSGVMAAFVVSWVLLIGLSAAGTGGFRAVEQWWFWALALAMFALAIVASLLYRIRLVRMTGNHLWLGGAGRLFYEGLPTAQE